jgi:hypothetical protein
VSDKSLYSFSISKADLLEIDQALKSSYRESFIVSVEAMTLGKALEMYRAASEMHGSGIE